MKSNVSNLLEVMQSIYKDACIGCIADVSNERDLITIRSRVEQEGISFLTITLPTFARDFERSLEQGYIDSTCFTAFKKISIFRDGRKIHGPIPAFLQGMVSLLFNKENGRYEQDVTDSFNASSIVGCVRQICRTFNKLKLPCTPERDQVAIASFSFIEYDFSSFHLSDEDHREFSDTSSHIWDNIVYDISHHDFVPRHGPGKTADKRLGNQKFVWTVWHERLEPYFPLIDGAYTYSAIDSEELQLVDVRVKELEQPVKVVLVPKTLKSPRVIAIEPCCMQYAQQGIRDVLYKRLESNWLTSGHINFRDQTINQSLALAASKSGQFSTIDLSEASDRVPRSLALSMFSSNRTLYDSINACRSTHAMLPGGDILPLQKFASMGSALCFPVESMYFYTICVAALLKSHGLPLNHGNIYKVSRDVYVYGDDIIVPSKHATVVLDYLQKYNCKVNKSKTFVTGKFRESCGLDAFDGDVVTPTYIREMPPQNKREVSSLISFVATANLFYRKGYWNTSSTMFNMVERVLGPLPWGPRNAGYLCKESFQDFLSYSRWNGRYHCFEVKAWVPEPVYRTDKLDGFAALQKSLSKLSSLKHLDDSRDEKHLERSALHGEAALKHRWVVAYKSGNITL